MIAGGRVPFVVLIALNAAATAAAQGVYFKHGEIRFKVGDQSYQYALRPDTTSPSINEGGNELRLTYEGPRFGCCVHATVEIVLSTRSSEELRAPGSYSGDTVAVLAVEWLPAPTATPKRWVFIAAMHEGQCAVSLLRLGSSGVSGGVSCTGGTVPFRDMEFVAVP